MTSRDRVAAVPASQAGTCCSGLASVVVSHALLLSGVGSRSARTYELQHKHHWSPAPLGTQHIGKQNGGPQPAEKQNRLPSLVRDDRRKPGVVPPCFRRINDAPLAWPVSGGQPFGSRVVSQCAWCRNSQPGFQLAGPTREATCPDRRRVPMPCVMGWCTMHRAGGGRYWTRTSDLYDVNVAL